MFMLQGSGCKKEKLNGIRQTTFNTPFDLQLSEKVLLTSSERELMIELRGITDNRCAGSPCEHAGNALVRVFIQDEDHQAEAETNLCIGVCEEQNKTSDTVSIPLDDVTYDLILKNVHGSPDKKAELLININ